jgi:predicted dehydrogenase
MPGLPDIPDFDLVAVCDLKRDLAERNARRFGARAVYTDTAEMLAKEAPEAVIVVGPPQMHEEVGLQVLAAGCHLFVEKPAAPTVEGAKRLVDAAERAGKLGQVGHMMRHAAPIRIAWEISHAEEFGKILSVESKYVTWPSAAARPGSGWGDADEDWMYMLNQGGHPIDLMRHFLGPIRRIAAFRSHGAGAAKVYQVCVEGDNGAVGFLNLQDSYEGWYTGLEVVGDGKGVVRVDDLGRVTYRRGERRTETEKGTWGLSADTWEPHHMLKLGDRAGYGQQFWHFAECIRTGAEPKPSLRDGWLNLVVGRAILDAVATGRPVEIPEGL